MPNQITNNKSHSASNGRTFAIGDIHGHHLELFNLIYAIAPSKDDTLIFLGDYVDRGPDSMAVIDEIIALQGVCQVIMLKGNHEVFMVNALTTENLKSRHNSTNSWMQYGGIETLQSYGLVPYEFLAQQLLSDKPTAKLDIPNAIRKHISLIQTLPIYHITDTHIFVHASPKLDIDIEDQDEEYLLWRKTSKRDAALNYVHKSGKTIICGHTDQEDGMPKKLSDKNIVIDSGCYKTGWLTAIDVDSGRFIQASRDSYRWLDV